MKQSKEFISTKVELKKFLKREWKNISIEYCRKLIDSMPKRIQKVLDTDGKKINY
mgnify:CR=1 FL=1